MRFRFLSSLPKDKQKIIKGVKTLKTTKQHETYGSIEEYEENCYLFSPSVSQRRKVGGKSYYVRKYFRGGQDFERTMERVATKRANQRSAG